MALNLTYSGCCVSSLSPTCSINGCWCDQICHVFQDCCSDVNDIGCYSVTSSSTSSTPTSSITSSETPLSPTSTLLASETPLPPTSTSIASETALYSTSTSSSLIPSSTDTTTVTPTPTGTLGK